MSTPTASQKSIRYKRALAKAKQRRERRAAGLCADCDAPSEKWNCEQCYAEYIQRRRIRQERLKQRLGEIGCAETQRQVSRYKHALTVAKIRQERRDAGLCAYCGTPSATWNCEACERHDAKQAMQNLRKMRAKLGQCVYCGDPDRTPACKTCLGKRARRRKLQVGRLRINGDRLLRDSKSL